MITLITVTVNLAGMLLIYSFIAFFLARLHWHAHGIPAIVVTIISSQVFWILPTMIGLKPAITQESLEISYYGSYSFFFGNWLVSAFSIILFCHAIKGIPRQLEDSARLDGCSWFATYRHAVLPLLRRELGLIALLIIIATAVPLLAHIVAHVFSDPLPLSTNDALIRMLAWSAIATVFVVAIFFIAKRRLGHDAETI